MSALELYKAANVFLSQKNTEKARPILTKIITQYPDTIYAEQAASDISDIDEKEYYKSTGTIYTAPASNIKNIILILITPLLGVISFYFLLFITPFALVMLSFSWMYYLLYLPVFSAYYLIMNHSKKTSLIKNINTSILSALTASLLSSIIMELKRTSNIDLYFFINEVINESLFLLKLSLGPAIIGSVFLYYLSREKHYLKAEETK